MERYSIDPNAILGVNAKKIEKIEKHHGRG
jgi:hypothetical protein